MTLLKPILAATAAAAFALPALAGTIVVKDAYARASTPISKSGAAFMVIENTGEAPDRLVGASTDIAAVAELHTHKQAADGVVKMVAVPEGFPIPAHGMHALKRGGDHVMLMGLKEPLTQGRSFGLTLTFEKAGKVTVTVPVDLTRGAGMKMNMSD